MRSRHALENSGIDASEITYVNAHGPGTKQCDTCESEVLDTLFPNAEGIFSVKPLAGHCQGAAGSVELIATLHGFETGLIPATPACRPRSPATSRRADRRRFAARGQVVARDGRLQRRHGPGPAGLDDFLIR